MIRTDEEYRLATARVAEERKRLAQYERSLRDAGLDDGEVKRMLDPARSFHAQQVEETKAYARLKRGELGDLENLRGLGRMLVAARVARGLTQRELAGRLGVHESQVSRDERNEYHGVTLERAVRVLEALGIELRSVARLAS